MAVMKVRPAKQAESRREIAGRQTIAEHIADWFYNNGRIWTVDSLLCRPTDCMKMAMEVAVLMERLKGKPAQRIAKLIEEIERDGQAVDVIDEICRAMLASRKRGELTRG